MRKFLILSAAVITFGWSSAAAEPGQVTPSEAFQEKLTEEYGQREWDRLSAKLQSRIDIAFEDRGLSDVHYDVHYKVVIVDATPNHPTWKQASDTPGLDMFRSVSLGGAVIEGTSFDANGNELAKERYSRKDHDLQFARTGSTWSGATRAMTSFSKKFADATSQAINQPPSNDTAS